jgi:outer membrane biosynthesis protein TonB
MATWSSFEKDRLLAENWRKFVKNNPEDKSSQTVFGINSEDNTESLLSFLKKNQGAIGLTPEQVNQLVALMLAQTKEDDVVLEAIGGPQRDARTFSSDTTTKLNALIKTFGLNDENERKLEKVLNRWAKLNTVSFEQGAPATPVVPEEEPDEDEQTPTEEPEQATSAAPVVPEEEPEKETPSRIDLLKPPRSLRDVKGSENYKKFMASLLDFFANQMKIDIKIAKKIVRDIWAKTPVSGKFNKLVFKEQMEKEIDIAAILANSGLNPTQQIKVLGALKKWAAQNSDLIDDRMTKILKLRDDEEQKPQPSSAETEAPTPDTSAETDPEAPQPPSKSKKKRPPPVKNQEAYDHGKQGKSMSPTGDFRDFSVTNIDATIKNMINAKAQTDEKGLRDKIESYINGLQDFQDQNETPTKLEESLMLRWKTIAGIK